MELTLEAAVLHVLDPGADLPVLSQTLLTDEDALHYLGGLAAKAWNSEEAKNCSFTSESPLLAHLGELDQAFLSVTADLAQSWFDVLRENPSIPAADAAFLLLNIDGNDYFAGLKLNYKTGYAHFFDMGTGDAVTGITRQDFLLPGTSGKADEAFFVDLASQQVRVLEKKYEIDGHKDVYKRQAFSRAMINSIFSGNAQFQEMVRQIFRVGGITQLIVDHFHRAEFFRRIADGLHKVLSGIPVQPGSAHDKVTAAKAFYVFFSQKFGGAIGADGAGLRSFVQRHAPVFGPAEHIIRGNMDQLRTHFFRSHGKVPGAQRVHFERRIPVCLAPVHIGNCLLYTSRCV